MSIAKVTGNQVAQHFVGATTGQITYPNPVNTGDVIGVFVATNSTASAAPSSVVDSNSDSPLNPVPWTASGLGESSIGVWLFVVGAGGSSFKITVNFASGTTFSALCFDYLGVNNTTPVDGSASAVNKATSASPSAAALTPSQIGDQQLAFLAFDSSQTFSSWGNSLSTECDIPSNSPAAYFGDNALASTSAVSASATLSASCPWNMVQFLLQPAATITYTKVSSVAGSFTGTGTTYTLTEAVGVYDLIVFQWELDNVGSAIVPGITDTVSGAYSQAGTAYYYSTSNRSWGQSFVGCVAAATPVITLSAPAANGGQYVITHYSGFVGPPRLDVNVEVNGTGTSISNTGTTTHASELALTNTFSPSATISGTPSGWTSTTSGGDGSVCQPYWQSVATTGSVSLSATLSASAFYYNWIFSFYNGRPPNQQALLYMNRRNQLYYV